MSDIVQKPAPKLGILAGGGVIPQTLMAMCRKVGRDYFVMCLEGQADEGLASDQPHVWLALGAGAQLKAVVAEQKIEEIVMIGRVRRPSLLEIKPDWLALKVLTKIGMNMLGDDALLRSVGKSIEEEVGVKVVGVHEIFADFLTPAGQLGQWAPDQQALDDIARGWDVALHLGRLDIGQSVVIQQGIVLGVEAIEGTDALIARCGSLQRQGPAGILVKVAKPQQDNRFDLPTVGPATIEALVKAGLRGLALEAGRSLLVDREKTLALADAAGLFIVAQKSGASSSDSKP